MIRKWLFRTGIKIILEKEELLRTDNLTIIQLHKYKHMTKYYLGLPVKRRKILIATERKVKYHETIQEA